MNIPKCQNYVFWSRNFSNRIRGRLFYIDDYTSNKTDDFIEKTTKKIVLLRHFWLGHANKLTQM